MAMPHKGPRDSIFTKPTIDVGLAVRREAADNKLTPGQFIAQILADRYGLPATNPTPIRQTPQQELPMTG